MSGWMTDDAVVRTAKLSESEGIRGRAVENEKNLAVGFKDFPHAFAHAVRPLVFAVGNLRRRVGFDECLPSRRTDRGRIVAGEFKSLSCRPHRAFPYATSGHGAILFPRRNGRNRNRLAGNTSFRRVSAR